MSLAVYWQRRKRIAARFREVVAKMKVADENLRKGRVERFHAKVKELNRK